ncbi:hypothetical protein DFJ73DRAFT_934402 [Zopfochytrium polystomum]|nr:hypothetical protein DFJ73DRAFT_934402 [Zopfochytrium polystomum]
MQLIEKLYSFPLFEFYLFPEGLSMYLDPIAPVFIQPVPVLWDAFRLGAPLCMVYNHLNLAQPLKVSDVSSVRPGQYVKVCKDNVYHFVVACKDQLHIPEAKDFTPSELYKDDTHGFMKVLKMVQEIVSRIEANNLMPPKRPFPIPIPPFESLNTTVAGISDNRSKLLREMVDTERTYVASLEQLYTYMQECEAHKILQKDHVRNMFVNLPELLDFQRRFLIAMETTLVVPVNEQRIGALFLSHETGFDVYHSFCSNYNNAVQTALDESENLKRLSHIIEPIQLQSFFIKPVQRVCRYPLLLQELIKLTDAEKYPFLDEIKDGLEAIKRVTEKINEQSRRLENEQKKADLASRVEDWKGLNIAEFGELLLSEKFMMATQDQEREYDLFLFEHILICCKDVTKQRRKKSLRDTSSHHHSGPTYAVRGNIQITSISRVEDTSDKAGNYSFKVYWEDGLDNVQFSLKCRNAEQVRLWKDRIERLVHGGKSDPTMMSVSSSFSRSSSNASTLQSHPSPKKGQWGRSLSSGSAIEQTPPAYTGPIGRSGSIPNSTYGSLSSMDASSHPLPPPYPIGRSPSQQNSATYSSRTMPAALFAADPTSGQAMLTAALMSGQPPPAGFSDVDDDNDEDFIVMGRTPADMGAGSGPKGDEDALVATGQYHSANGPSWKPRPSVSGRARARANSNGGGSPVAGNTNGQIQPQPLPGRFNSESTAGLGAPTTHLTRKSSLSARAGPGPSGSSPSTSPGSSLLRRTPSSAASHGPPVSTAVAASEPPTAFIKIKTLYNSDLFLIAVPVRSPSYGDLVARLERKIKLCGGTPPSNMRIVFYRGGGGGAAAAGEDNAEGEEEMPRRPSGEEVVIESDREVELAFADAVSRGGGTLQLYVS